MVIFSPEIAKIVNLTLANTYFSKISPNVLSKKAHNLSGHNALGSLVLCTFLPWYVPLGNSIHKASTYGHGPFEGHLGGVMKEFNHGNIQRWHPKFMREAMIFSSILWVFKKFDKFSNFSKIHWLSDLKKKQFPKNFCC
jgi:hypothetical protein